MASRRRLGASAWVLLFAALCGVPACDPGEARAPNPVRPIDERRAIELIAKAIKSEGEEPSPGRDEPIPGTAKSLHITAGVQGKRYGVAYVTADAAASLADAIPPPNRKDEMLKLKRLGNDGETHVLLLYQQNYVYDDLVGESHEQTAISAERALTRDVRDFVVHSRARAFK
jgi:hypothetical protein